MSITVMGGTTLPVVPMLVAFVVGFIAGMLYRQTRWLALIIFLIFVALVSGVISLSFTVNPA
jgi:hypothetical protein